MTYRITNTSGGGKSYEASNGKRVSFGPGETKEIGTLPPEVEEAGDEAPGWRIELLEEDKTEEKDEEGGE